MPALQASHPSFQRLWKAFLTARLMVALALLLLQLLAMALNQTGVLAPLGVALGYLLATSLLLVFGARMPPDPRPGLHWLPSIGVDLVLIALLQMLHQSGSMNFTPLFGLPILMAAVLGTLTLALGTTAGATLLLLAWAWWLGDQGGGDAAQRYLQTALTGTGYFFIAYLVHQLAVRLSRERIAAGGWGCSTRKASSQRRGCACAAPQRSMPDKRSASGGGSDSAAGWERRSNVTACGTCSPRRIGPQTLRAARVSARARCAWPLQVWPAAMAAAVRRNQR